jgi:hypothetical protein
MSRKLAPSTTAHFAAVTFMRYDHDRETVTMYFESDTTGFGHIVWSNGTINLPVKEEALPPICAFIEAVTGKRYQGTSSTNNSETRYNFW